jgi:hypothetical protein
VDPSGSRQQKNIHQKEKSEEISCFKALDVLFEGLVVSSVAWKSLYCIFWI